MKSLYTRIFLIIMGVLIIIFCSVLFATYTIATNILSKTLSTQSISIAEALSHCISHDVNNYLNLISEKDITSSYSQEMNLLIERIKKSGNIKYIYTLNKTSNDTLEYILEGATNHFPDSSYTISNKESLIVWDIFQNKESVMFISEIKNGMMGSFAPIFDYDNNVIGLVGVDTGAKDMFSYLNILFLIITILFAILFILGGICLRTSIKNFFIPIIKDEKIDAYNSRFFNNIIKHRILKAIKRHEALSIALINFDQSNVKTLPKITTIINSHLNNKSYLIRYDNINFMIISFLGHEDTKNLCERIRIEIENCNFYDDNDNIIKKTICMGLTNTRISKNNYWTDVLTKLERAKKQKNCIIDSLQ